ncbi:hypothetical protein NL676_007717 [Syzygium grande]|nr:hypothetical protein NL676_007717 [Syzygium grande]
MLLNHLPLSWHQKDPYVQFIQLVHRPNRQANNACPGSCIVASHSSYRGTWRLTNGRLRSGLQGHEMMSKHTRKLPQDSINLRKVSTRLERTHLVSLFPHSFVDSPVEANLR